MNIDNNASCTELYGKITIETSLNDSDNENTHNITAQYTLTGITPPFAEQQSTHSSGSTDNTDNSNAQLFSPSHQRIVREAKKLRRSLKEFDDPESLLSFQASPQPVRRIVKK